MKIKIVAIGKLKEKFLVEGVNEYLKRLKNFAKVEVSEIAECRTVEEEGQKILSQVLREGYIVALDVAGEMLTSEKFAEKIAALNLHGVSDITFIIGGAFGLSDEVKRAADFCLSFSEMTFTHQMARLILVEQIYRAFKINRNEPYHY